MSSQLGTGFLLFAARSTLTNRVTSFWKLHSPPQLVLNIELQNLLLETPGGDWHVLRDVRTLFFLFHLPDECLFTHKSFKWGSPAWLLLLVYPRTSWPLPKGPCFGASLWVTPGPLSPCREGEYIFLHISCHQPLARPSEHPNLQELLPVLTTSAWAKRMWKGPDAIQMSSRMPDPKPHFKMIWNSLLHKLKFCLHLCQFFWRQIVEIELIILLVNII